MGKIQYTVRGIPPPVDKVLKKRAKQEGKSFNALLVELLTLQALGSTDVEGACRGVFDRLRGAKTTLDGGFDEAIADQSKVDESMWPKDML